MNVQKQLQVLKTAYEAEKEGLRTYLKFAKETSIPTGKNMFIQLALDELDHMELIEKVMEDLMTGNKFQPVKVSKGHFYKFMPSAKDVSLQKIDKAELGNEEALKIALEHEKKAYEFYANEAKNTDTKELKELFESLAEVEQKHYDIIQAELDSIRNSGFWFDTREFSVEM